MSVQVTHAPPRHGWLRTVIRGFCRTAFFIFVIVTVWRLVFQDFLEASQLHAAHMDAGAGDQGLVVQFWLGALVIVLVPAWVLAERLRKWRLSAVASIAVVPFLFLYTARGVQRFPAGYSEEAFQRLTERYVAGHAIHRTNIVAALGSPLAGDARKWLYSYMPSCGYGWDKKMVFFNSEGWVSEMGTYSEP